MDNLIIRARKINKDLRLKPIPISSLKPLISELIDRIEKLEKEKLDKVDGY